MIALAKRFLFPLALSVAVLAGALAAMPPVRDAISRLPVAGAHLVRSTSYVIVAPLSDTLDAMTLLSVRQLIALSISLVAVYGLWRLIRRRGHATDAWCEFCTGLRAFLIFLLLVIFAAVLPRPMAALRMDDENIVLFDVHSHTNFSHDGRATFTVDANRAWHRDAGFDVAYITDHRCFDGAAEGERGNPKRAGDGTVLLSGIELPPDQLHVIELLPPDAAEPEGLMEAWCVRAKAGRTLAVRPVRIQTIPEDLNRVKLGQPGTAGSMNAIEILDGAPRGIAQAQRDRKTLLTLTLLHQLAAVAGSDNHGWGRTAVAWNAMHLHQWRAMPPDSVGYFIEMRIRAEKTAAVQVIERRTPDGASAADVIATLPLVLFEMLRTMTWGERLSWLIWIWVGVGVLVRLGKKEK